MTCAASSAFTDHADAAALTQLGLYSLQHRGQESAGIVAVERRRRRAQRAQDGTRLRRLGARELDALHGDDRDRAHALQHRRLVDLENAQPVLARFARRPHRARAQRQPHQRRRAAARARGRGSIFASTMDSEVIVHRLARSTAHDAGGAGSPTRWPASRARTVCSSLVGDTLLAARDPRGWRPLVMGRLGRRVRLRVGDVRARHRRRDVRARGRARRDHRRRRRGRALDHAVRRRRSCKRCVFEHVYFARPDSRVFGGSVDRARRALGRQLAREHPAPGADLVFSVPDSSNSAALGFAEESGLPYELALIRNHYVGRTFIQPTQADRDAKVKVKYNAVREVLEGKSVVMVDDSIVRGTTTRGLVALVRAAGAREVHMRVSSPPITGPCYYGIDTPSREELIAANHTLEEIRASLGVDSLGYLSLDGMLESVPGGPDGFCHACFSGDYPTPPPTDPDKLRFGCGC